MLIILNPNIHITLEGNESDFTGTTLKARFFVVLLVSFASEKFILECFSINKEGRAL